MSQFRDKPVSGSASLPGWLQWQAATRGAAVGLRHKKFGIWQAWRWQQLLDQTSCLAAGLARHGFASGSSLVLLSSPRPEVLLLSLAAQWLGGEAVPLDPSLPVSDLQRIVGHLAPEHVFAEGLEQVEQVLAAHPAAPRLWYADRRGLAAHPYAKLQAYESLLEGEDNALDVPLPTADAVAFRFWRVDEQGHLLQQALRQGELLAAGEHLLLREGLTEREEALAARAFATTAQVRYLLAPWLLAGFRLNFPENLATRDIDRRELGPTLVAGTADTFGRLEQLALSRLPEQGSWQRKLVERALAPEAGWWWHALGFYIVRRPLRDVLGLSRTRTPLVVGRPLPESSQRFFTALGIQVHHWPDPADWQPQPQPVAPERSLWASPSPGRA